MDYLNIYNIEKQTHTPEASIERTISVAGDNHPSLKQYLTDDSDLLVKSLKQSARVLLYAIRDFEDFTKTKVRSVVVEYVQSQVIRSFSHLSHYLGTDCVKAFVRDISSTPIEELTGMYF